MSSFKSSRDIQKKELGLGLGLGLGLKAYIQNLVKNDTVVSEKSKL